MSAGAALRVRVVDEQGGPLESARVYFVRAPVPVPEVAALTDASGIAILAAPAPGRYVVGARVEGLGESSAAIEVAGEAELDLELRLA